MDARHRGLVRNAPEAEGQAGVARAVGVGDAVETVEAALRPRALQSRHPADGAVAVGGEVADEGGTVGGEQQRVVRRVAGVDAGEHGGVRQPGGAAEGRRDHAAGDGPAAAGGDRGGELLACVGERRSNRWSIESDCAVGLGEQDQDVGAAQRREVAAEVGVGAEPVGGVGGECRAQEADLLEGQRGDRPREGR